MNDPVYLDAVDKLIGSVKMTQNPDRANARGYEKWLESIIEKSDGYIYKEKGDAFWYGYFEAMQLLYWEKGRSIDHKAWMNGFRTAINDALKQINNPQAKQK